MADRWSVRFLRARTPRHFYAVVWPAGVFAAVELTKGNRAVALAFAATAGFAALCGTASGPQRGDTAEGGMVPRGVSTDVLVVGLVGSSLTTLILATLVWANS